ncbi:uncharacterized protein LOC122672368 [Telopea speciosissima]|uniref:uncharacterized protein LOC122672368 n=1 Tax=Telopea speciosissima TaxID=54955 RepID=UPI001CC7CE23|nr:uncharacterized protein LOC122672368 [Telopea speciosissima]
MGENETNQRPLSEHFTPSTYTSTSCIRVPAVQVAQYEIKFSVIQMLSSFYGLNNKEPYKHLDEFLEIRSTVKIQNFFEDALRLIVFPFSLKDKAKQWLNSLDAVVITTWAQIQQAFLKKHFPIGQTNHIRQAITSFSQIDGEQFHETWERLKDLIRKCPHHAVPKWRLVQCFYDGLTDRNRQMVDASCGGTFIHKSENEAWQLFETLSENSLYHVSASRTEIPMSGPQRKGGLYEVGQFVAINTKVDMLSQKLDHLLSIGQIPRPTNSPQTFQDVCTLCTNPSHYMSEYPLAGQFPEYVQEQAQAAQSFSKLGNDPFSNTYNLGWRNHPNFGWKQPNGFQAPPYRQNFSNQWNAYREPQQPLPLRL